MKRLSRWFMRLSDRTVNALFIVFAIICISTLLTGVASWLSTRSRLPPFEYVYGLGERASMLGPNIVLLGSRSACAGDEITVPGYTIQINRAPIRVSLVATWWSTDEFRTSQVGGYADIAYTNYAETGRITIPEVSVTIPKDLEPGKYQRITTASTSVTFPEAYVLPVTVRSC